MGGCQEAGGRSLSEGGGGRLSGGAVAPTPGCAGEETSLILEKELQGESWGGRRHQGGATCGYSQIKEQEYRNLRHLDRPAAAFSPFSLIHAPLPAVGAPIITKAQTCFRAVPLNHCRGTMAFPRTGANRRLITQSRQANLAALGLSRSTDARFQAALDFRSHLTGSTKVKSSVLPKGNEQESAVISSETKSFSTFQERSRKSSHAN